MCISRRVVYSNYRMKLLIRRLETGPDRREMALEAETRILFRVRQDPNAAGVQRVLQLLKLMKEAEELRLRPQKGHSGDIHTLASEFKALLISIERLGKRYRWSPALKGDYSLGLTSTFTWSKRSRDVQWENEAVSWLMNHVSTSGLSPSRILRFRTCGWCSAWFYALTDHQHYCDAACRQKFHASSTEFRAKRAKYMRERYRPEGKERERRHKAFADRRRK